MVLRIPNAIDLHCHYGPDTIGGTLEPAGAAGVSAIQAAQDAAESGHAALVLKSHSFASPALAMNIGEVVTGLQVFGGICTDYPSGGLNVEGVEAALCLGAKIVWLPTVHSRQDVLRRREVGQHELNAGIAVVDDEGVLLREVREIFDLVCEKDAVLATGHISADEHFVVVKEFGRRGKVLVTHAGEKLAGPRLRPSQCAQLADIGAMIEVTALTCRELRGVPGMSPAEATAMLRAIGPSRCTLGTDYGWSKVVPRPASGMQEFLETLWGEGLTEIELTSMVSTNPAHLLGIEV
jgi:hypothetical protein